MQFLVLCLLALMLPLALFSSNFPGEKQKVVILLGAPASGKGTQAVRLAKTLALPHVSTGDLFRENIAKGTDLGKKAKEYMDSGKLVPDSLVLDMLFDRIGQNDAKAGYILDGFPRTLPQAEALSEKLPKNAEVIVLNLDVSDETITARALGRKRTDDTPEVVKERLKNYHAQTAPLIQYYQQKKLLKNINGEQSPDAVFEDLKKAL